jgi:hypothetical protein
MEAEIIKILISRDAKVSRAVNRPQSSSHFSSIVGDSARLDMAGAPD